MGKRRLKGRVFPKEKHDDNCQSGEKPTISVSEGGLEWKKTGEVGEDRETDWGVNR